MFIGSLLFRKRTIRIYEYHNRENEQSVCLFFSKNLPIFITVIEKEDIWK